MHLSSVMVFSGNNIQRIPCRCERKSRSSLLFNGTCLKCEEQLKAQNEPMGCGQFLLGILFWGTVLYLFGKVMANQGTRLEEMICFGIAILFCVLAFLGAKDMF